MVQNGFYDYELIAVLESLLSENCFGSSTVDGIMHSDLGYTEPLAL
jgi:hypothetical protein